MCFLFLFFSLSCGYTYHTILPGRVQSVWVTAFENQTFEPGLDIDFGKKLTERILFEKLVRLENGPNADAILRGTLLEYQREPLRYTDAEEVQEYRLKLAVAVALEAAGTHKILWKEDRLAGEATFFTAGSLSKSEETSREELLDDLVRRLTARLAEGWE
ncbi:MAG: hypothetical protein HYS56_06105 [Candidatus Omnitrophica bacterium]|nr:hypothetical protein [Candidatus Omnitrophota bacterium]